MCYEHPLDYSLYLVTDRRLTAGRDFLDCLRRAIVGGVSVVQLREKDLAGRELCALAAAVQGVTEAHGTPLIINDRLDVALAVGAAGVHLGQSDIPAELARGILGAEMLLGVSCNNLSEAEAATRAGADYIGVGALFPTDTKTDTRPTNLQEVELIKGRVPIPVLAIGGISQANAHLVWATGVDGICVSSAILREADVEQAARALRATKCLGKVE